MKATLEEKRSLTVAKGNGWLVICESASPRATRRLNTSLGALEQNTNRCPH